MALLRLQLLQQPELVMSRLIQVLVRVRMQMLVRILPV
jgi:hypothetical protein